MKDEEQPEQLERVSVRIGKSVLSFCESRVGQEFHADELRDFVMATCAPIAPASPDRVLRDLRKRGELDYEIVNRRQSKYRVLSVGPVEPGKLF
jgi:hypothetical protein